MINPADLKLLEAYRGEVLAAVCERHGVEPMNVCNWRSNLDHRQIRTRPLKTAPICAARYDLICILRTTVSQSSSQSNTHDTVILIARNGGQRVLDDDGQLWWGKPLSHPNIARLVGCNHVTSINALKRREKEHGDWRLTFTDYLQVFEAPYRILS